MPLGILVSIAVLLLVFEERKLNGETPPPPTVLGVPDVDRPDARIVSALSATATANAGTNGPATVGTELPASSPTPEEGIVTVAVPTSTPAPEEWCCFVATRFGEGYEGYVLGCPAVYLPAGRPDNRYHSADSLIMAPGPYWYKPPEYRWECGKYFKVINPKNGAELVVVRMSACPGCGSEHIDLSEAGMATLCGVEYPLTCDYLSGLIVQEYQFVPGK